MRFLRYVFKQKAVNEICNMIAPPDQFTGGLSETGTVQVYQAPLLWTSSFSKQLKRRTDSVAFRTVWEYLTHP
jgi:hypothetical protein